MSTASHATAKIEQIPTQTLDDAWHVASVVVHCQPDQLPEAKQWLTHWPSVEIHAEDPQGKLVLVVETQTPQAILDMIDDAQHADCIINAALVYHEVIDTDVIDPEEIAHDA